MRVGRIGRLVLLAVFAGCVSSQPAHFGQYNDLGPKVAATKGERLPLHVTVQLAKPANVAVFLVAPGRATTLLFPQDSVQPGFIDAGAHLVETTLAKNAVTDSSRLIRRPGQPAGTQPVTGNRQTAARGRAGDFGVRIQPARLSADLCIAGSASVRDARVAGRRHLGADRRHRRSQHGDEAGSRDDQNHGPLGGVCHRLSRPDF